MSEDVSARAFGHDEKDRGGWKKELEEERTKRWAAKGRAQRLYRLLIVRLRAIISSENGHFHTEGSNYARFAGYYY